ncbi:hypothetical protein [Virgibacillus sp. YIM 98842]|uniref:hypothetical protein n=1 Tax=Virgibacillus sp. YIM 98842 TaxID=2663533 RepID=UPI0013D91360|nr:hypothetical protein [Virgibacillus sp. YIM 98842]
MIIASRIESIGIIIASLAIGLISFYVLSDLPKKQKKKLMEELTSLLINFIIFIWVGKILLNISLFIQDPLAVLAYPGDSGAFYLAVLFTAISVIYKTLRKSFNIPVFAETFLHVFLVASFFYEFIQMILGDHTYSFGYMVVLAMLLILFFVMRGRISLFVLLITILAGWVAGVLVLSMIQPFVTVFGYIVAPWFIGLFFIGCLLIIIFSKRKRD